MKLASGQRPLRNPIKGMEPPSAMVKYSFPKKVVLAPLIAFSSSGGKIALSKPSPASI